MSVVDKITGYFTAAQLFQLAESAIILVIGVIVARLIAGGLSRAVQHRLDKQMTQVVRRFSFYGLTVLVVLVALENLGVQLTVLLGAAGVLTVAIGFASQTSASNLISGLFLLAERPFVTGDVIKVEATVGEVLSVDLLSVKLRTFDNIYVRIPNETLIKSQINNITHFPIRRLDIKISVAYKENLEAVRQLLFEVADQNPLCLATPKPLFIFLGYGESGIDLQFSVWFKRENFAEFRNAMPFEIKQAFDDAGIEIPFPHRTLYAGAITDPFPVRIAGDERAAT